MLPPWSLIDINAVTPALAASDIPAGVFNLDGTSGVFVPTVHIEQALSAIGADTMPLAIHATSRWDTQRVAFGKTPVHNGAMIKCHEGTSSAWLRYLQYAAQWFADLSHSSRIVLHHHPTLKHRPIADGDIHLFFGEEVQWGTVEWFFNRKICYTQNNAWIGELGPEHDSCRNLLPDLLFALMPRIAPKQFKPHLTSNYYYPNPGIYVLQKWARIAARNIVFHAWDATHFPPRNDGSLHIVAHGRKDPVTLGSFVPLKSCFGINVDGARKRLLPSKGIKNREIIEAGGDSCLTLYILYDLLWQGWTSTVTSVVDACLAEWLFRFPNNVSGLCVLSQLKDDEREIGRERWLAQARTLNIACNEEALDRLAARPYVACIWYSWPGFTVFTKPVMRTVKNNDGFSWQADGQFLIEVRDATNCFITYAINNLTPGNNHNLFSDIQWVTDGNPCFGTARENIKTLYHERKWSHLFDVIMEFLRAGGTRSRFTLCEKKGNIS